MDTSGKRAEQDAIVVVGSGVIGLTTALILARRGLRVKIIARDLPSDVTSQGFASPWAGANWCPFGLDPQICRWETEAYARLKELIPSGLAMRLPAKRFHKTEDGLLNHWYRDIVDDYFILDSKDCPPHSYGVSFTTLSVNAPVYCQWLQAQCTALGVSFERRELHALSEAVTDSTKVVINATGLGSKWLEEVKDELVEPIRGQVVVVRAPQVKTCTMDSTPSEPNRSTYTIPRPNSGGHVVCGGCYETGSTDREVNEEMSRDILEKCLAFHPELATKGPGIEGIDVVRHCVGFRPSRRGGPRLEAETKTRKDGNNYEVVHAYGIGPAGYQASWGMAKDACDLAAAALLRNQDARTNADDLGIGSIKL